MKIKDLHAWDISTMDAPGLQKQLAEKIWLKGNRKAPKIIAGADISSASPIFYFHVVSVQLPDEHTPHKPVQNEPPTIRLLPFQRIIPQN